MFVFCTVTPPHLKRVHSAVIYDPVGIIKRENTRAIISHWKQKKQSNKEEEQTCKYTNVNYDGINELMIRANAQQCDNNKTRLAYN